MREIKFRAWDKEKAEWLFGYELPSLGGFSMKGEVMMMGEYASLLSSYFPDKLNNIVLMQYTGLKDKNGKEIYEGDWLDWNEQADGIVEWKYGVWHVCLVKTKEYFFLYPANIAGLENGGTHPHVEVIGNIYENPELIQK